MLNNYEADFGLITSNIEPPEIRSKRVKKMAFKTFVSESHPLGKKRKVHIDDLVEHCFAIGNSDWIGEKSYADSSDGWRDDKFLRKKSIKNLTISCLEGLVDDGLAVTYLPEYYAERRDWRELTVEGCSFACAQSVFLITNKEETDPIWSLF
jgi:DNA-binding transcriptional LysR family regulator